MADDLGIQPGEVHGLAEAVIAFWFDEVPADKRFARDAALDAVIKARFGVLLETLIRTDAKGWRDDSSTLLASVIVIDKFSRTIHRGQAQAFAADPLALWLTELASAQAREGGM